MPSTSPLTWAFLCEVIMKSKEEVLAEAFRKLDQGVAPEQVLTELADYYAGNLDRIKTKVAKITSNVTATFQKVGELQEMIEIPGVIPSIHLHMLKISGLRHPEEVKKFMWNLQKRHEKATRPKE